MSIGYVKSNKLPDHIKSFQSRCLNTIHSYQQKGSHIQIDRKFQRLLTM